MGTEDRVKDPSKKVPSNIAIIPFVTFPGEEIKDLYVHEEVSAVSNSATASLPNPPATTPQNPNTPHVLC